MRENKILYSMVILAVLADTTHAQYLFSTSANGNGAYLASQMEGHSFVNNPAFLGKYATRGTTYIQTELTTGEKSYDSPFDPRFPDLEIWLPVTKRLNIAFRKIYGFPDPWYNYNPVSRESNNYIPDPSELKQNVFFKYQQGWSYGAGYAISNALSFGFSLRHAKYFGTGLSDEYLFLDIGSLITVRKNLIFAVVFRDFFPWRIKSSDRRYMARDQSVIPELFQTFYWDIDQWSDVQLSPRPFAEFGVSYMLANFVELLADYSSLNEYAWGVRLRFGKGFSIFGGHSHRYDHLCKAEPFASGSIGIQIKIKPVTLSGSFVWDQKHYFTRTESNKYGVWQGSQVTNKDGMFSLGFEF